MLKLLSSLDHSAIVHFFSFLAQVQTLLMLSLVRQWLDSRNTKTVAHFHTSASYPLKSAVMPVGCAPFSGSALKSASPFSNSPLSLTFLVARVRERLLDGCQVSSLFHPFSHEILIFFSHDILIFSETVFFIAMICKKIVIKIKAKNNSYYILITKYIKKS